MGRRKKRNQNPTGFEEWGGYMAMKKAKLEDQFSEEASKTGNHKSSLFNGIAIFVNGYTDPSSDELRRLMMEHGGTFHHYYRTGKTTYVIASNLPDSKLKQTQGIKFLKPSWVTDCINENKILDYKDYLLYTNQSKSQPGLKHFAQDADKSQVNQCSVKTATNKEFLSEFYSNSRLHHISTMGAIFKQYVNELRENDNHKFSGREELRSNLRKDSTELEEPHSVTDSKVIMHIDMDCFFVSVGIRDKPELKGVPVAVAHAKGNRIQPREDMTKEFELYKEKRKKKSSDLEGKPSPGTHWTDTFTPIDSMSEVASCSYEARAAGVKNGMFLGQALKLCPNLKSIHYDFEAYKEVSYALYDTVARYTLDIEAVSCDEMYVDCTELLSKYTLTPLMFANILRNEIKTKTRCPCSVGFGANRLQARIATKKAKPDGQYHLDSDAEIFFHNIPVSDLPGVGYSTTYKLKNMGVKTCGELQAVPLKKLQTDFGAKLGDTLYKHCRGIDDKDLVFHQVRKSVSADVNYGIRFENDIERDIFLEQLSGEVADRLNKVKMKGKSITLKLMVRSKDAPEESAKFLGHGVCDHITKSTQLPNAVADPEIIYREVMKIMAKIKVDSKDLRGIGIQLSRLEKIQDISDSNLMKFLNKKKEKIKYQDEKYPQPSTSKSCQQPLSVSRKKVDSKCLQNITISQVDESFLSAMPDDVREEIMRHLINNKKTKECDLQESISSSEETSNSTAEENLSGGSLDDNNSYVSPGELKNLLREWIEHEEIPLDRDISFVKNYLQELVLKGYLEELTVMLKYFFRFVERFSKADDWKTAYFSVLEAVQMKMISIYEGRIKLEEEYVQFKS